MPEPRTPGRSITDPSVSEELRRKGLLDSRHPAEDKTPTPPTGTPQIRRAHEKAKKY